MGEDCGDRVVLKRMFRCMSSRVRFNRGSQQDFFSRMVSGVWYKPAINHRTCNYTNCSYQKLALDTRAYKKASLCSMFSLTIRGCEIQILCIQISMYTISAGSRGGKWVSLPQALLV